jgi:hypothetical protein
VSHFIALCFGFAVAALGFAVGALVAALLYELNR